MNSSFIATGVHRADAIRQFEFDVPSQAVSFWFARAILVAPAVAFFAPFDSVASAPARP